jgi:hypothetical protein
MSYQQCSRISTKFAKLASLGLWITGTIAVVAIGQIITTGSAWAQGNPNVAQTSEATRIIRVRDLLPLQPASVLGGTVNAKCSIDITAMGIILPGCGAGPSMIDRGLYKQVEREINAIPAYRIYTEAHNDRLLIRIPL